MRTGSESTALTAAGLDDPEWTESVCRHTDARDERDRTQTTTEARLRVPLSHSTRNKRRAVQTRSIKTRGKRENESG
jgi:hypothetical protein